MNDTKHGWPQDARVAAPNWNGHFNDYDHDIVFANLPYHVNDQALFDLVAAHGVAIRARVIFDRITGHSRGFGFARCATPEDRENVIRALHGRTLSQRTLVVRPLTPRTPREGA